MFKSLSQCFWWQTTMWWHLKTWRKLSLCHHAFWQCTNHKWMLETLGHHPKTIFLEGSVSNGFSVPAFLRLKKKEITLGKNIKLGKFAVLKESRTHDTMWEGHLKIQKWMSWDTKHRMRLWCTSLSIVPLLTLFLKNDIWSCFHVTTWFKQISSKALIEVLCTMQYWATFLVPIIEPSNVHHSATPTRIQVLSIL